MGPKEKNLQRSEEQCQAETPPLVLARWAPTSIASVSSQMWGPGKADGQMAKSQHSQEL